MFIIVSTGGIIRDKQNATHFLVSRNKTNLLKEDKRANWKMLHTLNLKFVFHSFFFLRKVDENDQEYTELF
jgi:hypothetical protein